MRYKIFNFQFPSRCSELNIAGYRFYKVEEYKEKVSKLQHIISISSDITISKSLGQHTITGYVDIPEREKSAVLEWSTLTKTTALNDLLMLISVFTQRDVFCVDETFDDNNIEDLNISYFSTIGIHQYLWGGVLSTSIPVKKKDGVLIWDLEGYLDKIYSLIETQEWQNTYNKGYFLFLVKQLLRAQTIETAFVQAYTIWEHLFTLHNKSCLSDEKIRKISSREKISFILVHYSFMDTIKKEYKAKLDELVQLRNRLVHYGRFPDNTTREDALLFVRLTEGVVAKILGLQPSNVFGTQEEFEKFITK